MSITNIISKPSNDFGACACIGFVVAIGVATGVVGSA